MCMSNVLTRKRMLVICSKLLYHPSSIKKKKKNHPYHIKSKGGMKQLFQACHIFLSIFCLFGGKKHLVHFGLFWSTLIHLVYSIFFIQLQSIWFTLVYFGPIRSIQSTPVNSVHLRLLWFTSIYFSPFNLLRSGQSTSVQFDLLWSIRFTLVHVSLLESIRSNLVHLVNFV